jgi:Domain of unknown function (DUF6285)
MPGSRPPAIDLIDVVRDFLEREILPELGADRRFHCRVAINVLAIVRRELDQGPAADASERAELTALLGREGPVDELRRILAQQIRDGQIDASRPDLIAHLRRTVRDALAINNPKWLGEDSRQPGSREPPQPG